MSSTYLTVHFFFYVLIFVFAYKNSLENKWENTSKENNIHFIHKDIAFFRKKSESKYHEKFHKSF